MYQQQQQQETIELGNKRNQTRLLESINELTMQQKQSLLINILQCPIKERKAEILQLMRIIMQKVDFFQQFQVENIDYEAYDYCLKHLSFESFSKNTVIFEKGEQPHNMYVVIRGQVSLYSNDHLIDQTKTRKHSVSVDYGRESQYSTRTKFSDFKIKSLVRLTEFKDWKTFGEQAILDQRLRTNIAVCDTDSSLAILAKEDYNTAIQILDKKKEQHRMNKFKLNPSFQGLNKKLINIMLFTFQSSDYKFRDIIYKQGQVDSDTIYIIKQGEFLVYQDQSEQQIRVRKQIAIMTTGEMFGDYEAFERIPRQFNVQCNSHTASLIIIPLQLLNQKLSQQNEQHYVQQLKSLCLRKNRWYHDFKTNIEQTQGKYQHYLTVQDQKLSNVNNSSKKIESPTKIIKDIKQLPETIICVSPITELKNTLNYITSIDDSQINEQQEDINNTVNQKMRNTNTILISSPEKVQPLPKIKLISNRQQERNQLSTPDRFNQVIRHKMTILKRMHNLSPEESVNINTLQQKTIYVQLPKQLKLEQNIEKQWPIKATLYLNDLDDRIRYHSNNQKIQICNSSRDSSVEYEQLSIRNDGSEFYSQRTSRMGILNNILQHSVTKRGKNKKKRALTLKYREYLEQFPIQINLSSFNIFITNTILLTNYFKKNQIIEYKQFNLLTNLLKEKVDINALKKKFEAQNKKNPKDLIAIDQIKQKLDKYNEQNIDEQIKKYEKKKEDLESTENKYDFENLILYQQCVKELQDIKIDQQSLNEIFEQEGSVENSLIGQNQEKYIQNSEKNFQQNSQQISDEFYNKNQEEAISQQKEFLGSIQQIVNDQEQNRNINNQNEEIIQQEELDIQIKEKKENLEEKNQDIINEKIMELFFLKKENELKEIQQEIKTQELKIGEIEINIKNWKQYIQNIINYLKLIDTLKSLQNRISIANQDLDKLVTQFQDTEEQSKTLEKQQQSLQIQMNEVNEMNNQILQQFQNIDKQIGQINDRFDQVKTFQDYLIQFQTLTQQEKQSLEQNQQSTFLNFTLQEVLKKLQENEIYIQKLEDEQLESNQNLRTFNQIEKYAEKLKKQQKQLDQLTQNKLEVHSCLSKSHKCDQVCQICPNKICDKKAGHDQNQEHLCSEKDHKCNGKCDIRDCQSACWKSYGHEKQHNCQNDHPCNEKCNYCDKNCQTDRSIPHNNNHDCKDIYCNQNCSLCQRRCKDPHNKSRNQGHHFCDQQHYCQEKCDEKGICKIDYEIKEATWKSSISEFQYIKYIPKENGKQKCHFEIPNGKLKHDGKHLCKNDTDKQFHNCNQKCPECNTFCDLKYGHQGIHSSERHRNKENQIFTQKYGHLEQIQIYDSKDIIRKYQIGDSSEPETCDQSCKRRGKAHFHLVECKGDNLCLEQNQNFINKARHSTEKYVNFEEFNFDEVLCFDFWQYNQWSHPIQNEINNIRRCNYYCPLCYFQKKEYEFCELEAWHTKDNKISSHRFFCSEEHKKNQIQGINIAFVLDTTGSMANYIQMCKEIIKDIMKKAKSHKNIYGEALNVSFAVISYKDHDYPYQSSQKVLDVEDFTSENVIIEFLNKQTADGGGDSPEAVLDGLNASIKLTWVDKQYVRLLYLIAESPPHGVQYHNFQDNFPEGCPCKLNQKNILSVLWKKKIQFKILQLNESINGMISEFKKDFEDLEVMDPQNSDLVNSFKNLIVSDVCNYFVHNEITFQMKSCSQIDK